MGKSIKIDDDVYKGLDQYRQKGETFSMAIDKLLSAARHTANAARILGENKATGSGGNSLPGGE